MSTDELNCKDLPMILNEKVVFYLATQQNWGLFTVF